DRLILDDGDRRVRGAENVGRLLRAQGLIEGRGAWPGEHRRWAGDDDLRPVEGPARPVLPLLQAGVHEERGELVSLLLVRVPGEGNPVVARAVEHRRLVATRGGLALEQRHERALGNRPDTHRDGGRFWSLGGG